MAEPKTEKEIRERHAEASHLADMTRKLRGAIEDLDLPSKSIDEHRFRFALKGLEQTQIDLQRERERMAVKLGQLLLGMKKP